MPYENNLRFFSLTTLCLFLSIRVLQYGLLCKEQKCLFHILSLLQAISFILSTIELNEQVMLKKESDLPKNIQLQFCSSIFTLFVLIDHINYPSIA